MPPGPTVDDLGKLLRLRVGEIFEEALRHDEVEGRCVRVDGCSEDVALRQVRCRLVDRDVDPVVGDSPWEQPAERGGTTTHVEEPAVLTGGQPTHDMCHLEHPVMRYDVLGVLVDPKTPACRRSRRVLMRVCLPTGSVR